MPRFVFIMNGMDISDSSSVKSSPRYPNYIFFKIINNIKINFYKKKRKKKK
ncbi:hypothetical protein Hanom_Chr14g01285161 [Helianthus anomalus]